MCYRINLKKIKKKRVETSHFYKGRRLKVTKLPANCEKIKVCSLREIIISNIHSEVKHLSNYRNIIEN